MTKQQQRDLDCASLARDALFPLKISRDGSHPTQFPASEALGKIRDSLMANSPDKAASSFFPRRVVVVRDVSSTSGELKWNGQPDVSQNDASVEVIPNLLSVRCMQCGDGRDAFVEKDPDKIRRAIVLCSDRLLKRDYSPSNMPSAPQSLDAVEEVLAHHLTKIGDQLESERTNAPDPASTCQGLAAMEVRAARAAECYYSKAGKEVTRGSSLGPYGYSVFPKFLQEMLRNRCVRSAATRAMDKSEFGGSDGRQCVSEVFNEANRD